MITLRGAIDERYYTEIVEPADRREYPLWKDATIYLFRGKKVEYTLLGKRRGSAFPQKGDLVQIQYDDSKQPEIVNEEWQCILLEEIQILRKAPKNLLERLLEYCF